MRLFIAVNIPQEVRAGLEKAAAHLKKADADVRWVRSQAMHITLKFLGEVDENIKEKLIDTLQDILKEKTSFILSFGGLGVFPDIKRPRVIWVGAEGGSEELQKICREIDLGLIKYGFSEEERGVIPHLTLGRIKSSRGKESLLALLNGYGSFALPGMRVDGIDLMESVLKRDGPEYRLIKKFPLDKQRWNFETIGV